MTGDMYGSFNVAKARVEAPGLRAKAVATIARDFDDDLRDRYAAISTDEELEAEHQAARAQLQRCAWAECPVCHPRDGHLWRDASGSRRGWRLVYGPDDLATASVGGAARAGNPTAARAGTRPAVRARSRIGRAGLLPRDTARLPDDRRWRDPHRGREGARMSDQTAVAVHVPALGPEQIDLRQYQPEKYQVLARQEDLAAVAPILRAEVAIVKIDPRPVSEGGETHNIGGQIVPARSALDKVGDAAGVSFDAKLCRTWKEGPRLWLGRAVGRRRNPDSSWRTVSADYEWDVDVREAEARARLETQVRNGKLKAHEVEPRLAAEVIQMMKFGRARADTGARLRVIRILTGMKGAFARGELQRPFVLARFTVNTEAIMEDPEMRRALIEQTLGAAGDVYGPREPRNVTPAPEQLPDAAAGEPQHLDGEAPAEEEIPFEDDIPWDEDATPIARRRLENVIADARPLPTGKREEMQALVARADATAAEMDAFAVRAEDYWRKVEAAREARS